MEKVNTEQQGDALLLHIATQSTIKAQAICFVWPGEKKASVLRKVNITGEST